MSDIDSSLATTFVTEAQTRTGYEGFGTGNARVGAELELQFAHQNTGYPITIADNARLTKAAEAADLQVSQEAAAHMLEVKTVPYKPNDIDSLCDDLESQAQHLSRIADRLGFNTANSSYPARVPDSVLLAQIHPRPRSRIFLDYFKASGRHDVARYFASISGAQLSLSYEHAQHAYNIFRRSVWLLPLLTTYAAANPIAHTLECGTRTPITRNETLTRRLSPYGLRGAVSLAFFKATNPDAFLNAYDQAIWHTPLFSYYTPEGALVAAPQEANHAPLAGLPKQLQTAANYAMASSIQWQLVALSALPPNDQGIPRRRVEVRYLDSVPPDQRRAIFKLLTALQHNEDIARKLDDICARFGFGTQPAASPNTYNLWVRTLAACAATPTHKPEILSALPYGNSTLGAFASAIIKLCEQLHITPVINAAHIKTPCHH